MVPAWLVSSQPPLRLWLGLLARMVIGAFIAAAVVTLLKFPDDPAAWSVVAVVVVIGFNAGASTVAGVNRMQGSIVGCLTGGVTQFVLGGRIWLPFVAAIAVGLSVTFCRLLRIGAGFRLGGALAGFFIFVPGDEEWATVGWRLAATLLGIGIGMLVMLAWPARADKSVRMGIAGALRDCTLLIDASVSRWFGQDEPEGTEAARSKLRAGTTAVAAALADRSHERAGAWDASVYSTLMADLNDAMVTARRVDRVAEHQPGDALYTGVSDPFSASVEACRLVADEVASALESGNRVDRKSLLESADGLSSVPTAIQAALEQLRESHVTPNASAEELQRLFGLALLLGHWSESVRAIARDLALA